MKSLHLQHISKQATVVLTRQCNEIMYQCITATSKCRIRFVDNVISAIACTCTCMTSVAHRWKQSLDLIGMLRTDCSGRKRLATHVPSSLWESINIITIGGSSRSNSGAGAQGRPCQGRSPQADSRVLTPEACGASGSCIAWDA